MKKMTISIQGTRERNLEVLNPIMKKGGVHAKDNKSVKNKQARRGAKSKLKMEGY